MSAIGSATSRLPTRPFTKPADTATGNLGTQAASALREQRAAVAQQKRDAEAAAQASQNRAERKAQAEAWEHLAQAEKVATSLKAMMGKGGEFEDVRTALEAIQEGLPIDRVARIVVKERLSTIMSDNRPGVNPNGGGDVGSIAGEPVNLLFTTRGPELNVGETEFFVPMFSEGIVGKLTRNFREAFGIKPSGMPTRRPADGLWNVDVDDVRAQLLEARKKLQGIIEKKTPPSDWVAYRPWMDVNGGND